MTIKCGFEHLISTKEKCSAVEVLEVCSVSDMEFMKSEAEELSQENITNLYNDIKKMPKDQREHVLNYLALDPNFRDIIGSDKNIENLKKYIPSEEGQKLQDFFRWGLIGMTIGLYLGSFNRIKSRLSNIISVDLSARSQYLPPKTETIKALDAIETMIKAIKAGDPNKIIDTMNKIGYNIDKPTDTDWIAVLGSIAGALIFPFLGIIGNIVGKFISEKARLTCSEKGYSIEDVKKCAARIVKIIIELEAMKNQNITSKVQGAEKFAKKVLKLTCQSVSTLGRGLAVVVK